MSHSQRYNEIDEVPVRNADGVIVGYAYYEAYAELDVAEGAGCPELERIDAISHVHPVATKMGKWFGLPPATPFSYPLN